MARIPAFQAGCVGSIPITRSTSSRTLYRSWRLFYWKSHPSLTPSFLLSETGHAQVACSVVNALTTALFRYHPVSGFVFQLHIRLIIIECRFLSKNSLYSATSYISLAAIFLSPRTHSAAPPFRKNHARFACSVVFTLRLLKITSNGVGRGLASAEQTNKHI